MNIEQYLTQVKYQDENKFLHSKLFDVNMRLFKSSIGYVILIDNIINYMYSLLMTTFGDYTKLIGISGANVGIPYNIIIIINPNTSMPVIMINPKITRYHGEYKKHLSNCGSINLPKPIEVYRYDNIDVEYYNRNGSLIKRTMTVSSGSLIVQHEVDHNLGILITDKRSEDAKEKEIDLT